MNSLFLQPIIENDIKFIDFRYNKKIDAFFDPESMCLGSTETVLELMNIIDVRCGNTFDIELWTEGLASDFLIVVGAKEYRVHKSYLLLKSQLFIEMLKVHKDLCELKITDHSIEAVEDFLRFIYGVEDQTNNPLELFTIAAKFKVEELKEKIAEKLEHQVDKSNALEMFSLGHQYESEKLKVAAFKIIKKNFSGEDLPEEEYMNDPNLVKVMVQAALCRKQKMKTELDVGSSSKKDGKNKKSM
jgi:BTB/POZ domain